MRLFEYYSNHPIYVRVTRLYYFRNMKGTKRIENLRYNASPEDDMPTIKDRSRFEVPGGEKTNATGNPFDEKEPFSGTRVRIPETIGKELFDAIKDITPDTYAVRPIAKGGEHVVFEFDDTKHRGVVYKINFIKSIPVLKAHVQTENAHISHEIERRKAIEELQEEILERKGQLRELREYFGVAAVPVERIMVREVPVSRRVVDAIQPNQLPAHVDPPDKLPAWVMVQKRLNLASGQAISLQAGQPEIPGAMAPKAGETIDDVHQIYNIAHDILVGNDVEDIDPETARDYILDLYPNLHSIAEKIDDDPAFKEKLKTVAEQLIKYTDDTSMVLDFMGKGNIFLVKEKNGWGLKMPDPLPSGECTMFDLAIAAGKLKHNAPLNQNQVYQALLALNALRAINAVAILSGTNKRLKAPNIVTQIDPAIWREQLASQYQEAA